jgi:hypothetical protein
VQALYDDMLPGITGRQAASARELAGVADVTFGASVKTRADADRAVRELAAQDLDGLLVVMLTCGPVMHVSRALAGADLPARGRLQDVDDLRLLEPMPASAVVPCRRPFLPAAEHGRHAAPGGGPPPGGAAGARPV